MYQNHGVALGVGLDLLQQLAVGRRYVQVGDPGQRLPCLLTLSLDLKSKLGNFLLVVDQELLTLCQVARPLLEGSLPRGKALLACLHLDPPHL